MEGWTRGLADQMALTPARNLFVRLAVFAACTNAFGGETKNIGPDLYAYISDNDASANATFLVGRKEVLLVDAGLNAVEGEKILAAIRRVAPQPVKFLVVTHYHPDHGGGAAKAAPNAILTSTPFTRHKATELNRTGQFPDGFRIAEITTSNRLTIYVGEYPVEVYHPGPAHTMGDLLVYFPTQQVLSTGDLFLNRSCPAMDEGSVQNWVKALDEALRLPLRAAVPGHFEVGTKQDLKRFRDYLADLYAQVAAMKKEGVALDQIKHRLALEQYRDFRQYPKYQATFADNAEAVYRQLAGR
jgi:cyclase